MKKAFAALRGMAGALLGAYLAAWAFWSLFRLLEDTPLDFLALPWGFFSFCPAAYLGYWCFRGLRNWRFGYGTAWICAVAALPLVVRPGTLGGRFGLALYGLVFAFLSCRLGRERFLKYLDPVWYRDPRRIAEKCGRGRLSGHWHISPPFGPEIPPAFDVRYGSTVLHVLGDTIRVETQLHRSWTFSLQDVEGVIQAPGVGHCIPYNAQGQALAIFCLSEKNGELLARHMRNRDIPFYRLSEVPKTGPLPGRHRPQTADLTKTEAPSALGEAVWEAVAEYAAELEDEPEEEIRCTDLGRVISKDAQDFRLQLRRTRSVPTLLGVGAALSPAALFTGFPVVAFFFQDRPGADLALWVLLAASVLLAGGPLVYALVTGDLLPAYVFVESGHIWLDKGFRPIREIPLRELDRLGWNASDECYILFDKQGKALLKFSTRDEHGPRFMNFLTDHNIRLRSEP